MNRLIDALPVPSGLEPRPLFAHLLTGGRQPGRCQLAILMNRLDGASRANLEQALELPNAYCSTNQIALAIAAEFGPHGPSVTTIRRHRSGACTCTP